MIGINYKISSVPFVLGPPAIPSGAPRKNHTWETRHLAGPIRDVGSGGRRESVAGAPRRCGFDATQPLVRLKVDVAGTTVCLLCFVGEPASF